MASYWDLIPADICYILLMGEAPHDLMKIRMLCPQLKQKSQERIFRRDYRKKWRGENDLTLLPLTRARNAICDSLNTGTSAKNYLYNIYAMEDVETFDWLLQLFTHGRKEYQLITHFTAHFEDPVFDQFLIQRLLAVTSLTAASLCNGESPPTVQIVQSLYPKADYTSYYQQLIGEPGEDVLTEIQRGYTYNPQILLLEAMDRHYDLFRYLLKTHHYEDFFLYLVLAQTKNDHFYFLLRTQALIDLAIQKQNHWMVYWQLTGFSRFSLQLLAQAEHQPFLQELILMATSLNDLSKLQILQGFIC